MKYRTVTSFDEDDSVAKLGKSEQELAESLEQERSESPQRFFMKPFQCFCHPSISNLNVDALEHENTRGDELRGQGQHPSSRQELLEQALTEIMNGSPDHEQHDIASRALGCTATETSEANTGQLIPPSILNMDQPYHLDMDFSSCSEGGRSQQGTQSETLESSVEMHFVQEEDATEVPLNAGVPVADYSRLEDHMDKGQSIEKGSRKIVDPSLAAELAIHLKMLEEMEFFMEEQNEFKMILRRISDLSARITRGEIKFTSQEHADIKVILKRIADSSKQSKLEDDQSHHHSLRGLDCETKEDAEMIDDSPSRQTAGPISDRCADYEEKNDLRCVSTTSQSFTTPTDVSVTSTVTSFSSIVSFRDSFGDERVAKLTAASLNNQCRRLTPHAFFWRSHPSVTTASLELYANYGKGKATNKAQRISKHAQECYDNEKGTSKNLIFRCVIFKSLVVNLRTSEETHIDPTFVRQALQIKRSALCHARLQYLDTTALYPAQHAVTTNGWVEFSESFFPETEI
jgi:hypothetical protein